jgi:hypothetical protein
MSKETLGERGKALEGKFFKDLEQEQIDAFKTKQAKAAAVAELAEITGFTDKAVLQRVVDLGVTPMTLAAFSIVPMLYVAWSDRVLDASERRAILLEATAAGLKSTSAAYGLLETWLTERPNKDLFQAWKEYHAALMPLLGAKERAALKADVLGKAERVARASGGFLGVATVSNEEREALRELTELLS